MKKVNEILKKFGLSTNFSEINKINSGHINSTYKIIYSDNSCFILQRINGSVFTKPEEIMSNIMGVCSCLKEHICCPEFLKYRGKNYIIFENEMWRIYRYIENSVSYVTIEDYNYLYEFGRVVGQFHSLTNSLDTNKFYNIIENFHKTSFILKNTIKYKNDKYKFEFEFFEKMLFHSDLLDRKNIPLKVTHNDIKPSNVLFDRENGKGITLIDFDTVMPGKLIYDFGDGARSACITCNKLDLNKFNHYCKGYFSYLKPENPENYFLGMLCITSELSARYFTDFITDGSYFSDKTPEQKLLRCHELIQTAESILENKTETENIIRDCL